MKYHRLLIGYDNPSFETYDAITQLLGVAPEPWEKHWFSAEEPDSWSYLVISNEEAPYFDFINVFLDLLEPKLDALLQLGVEKANISLSLTYQYTHQCALGFDAQEMLRLGQSGLGLSIDCHEDQ
ncbi:hypothetical protein [Hymenobacter sp. UYP22]|uniref:hypothetical protein n=1 Tax=Hymenobacter sp. UYP22 TaxID=3156348 RepID=UPI003391C953